METGLITPRRSGPYTFRKIGVLFLVFSVAFPSFATAQSKETENKTVHVKRKENHVARKFTVNPGKTEDVYFKVSSEGTGGGTESQSTGEATVNVKLAENPDSLPLERNNRPSPDEREPAFPERTEVQQNQNDENEPGFTLVGRPSESDADQTPEKASPVQETTDSRSGDTARDTADRIAGEEDERTEKTGEESGTSKDRIEPDTIRDSGQEVVGANGLVLGWIKTGPDGHTWFVPAVHTGTVDPVKVTVDDEGNVRLVREGVKIVLGGVVEEDEPPEKDDENRSESGKQTETSPEKRSTASGEEKADQPPSGTAKQPGKNEKEVRPITGEDGTVVGWVFGEGDSDEGGERKREEDRPDRKENEQAEKSGQQEISIAEAIRESIPEQPPPPEDPPGKPVFGPEGQLVGWISRKTGQPRFIPRTPAGTTMRPTPVNVTVDEDGTVRFWVSGLARVIGRVSAAVSREEHENFFDVFFEHREFHTELVADPADADPAASTITTKPDTRFYHRMPVGELQEAGPIGTSDSHYVHSVWDFPGLHLDSTSWFSPIDLKRAGETAIDEVPLSQFDLSRSESEVNERMGLLESATNQLVLEPDDPEGPELNYAWYFHEKPSESQLQIETDNSLTLDSPPLKNQEGWFPLPENMDALSGDGNSYGYGILNLPELSLSDFPVVELQEIPEVPSSDSSREELLRDLSPDDFSKSQIEFEGPPDEFARNDSLELEDTSKSQPDDLRWWSLHSPVFQPEKLKDVRPEDREATVRALLGGYIALPTVNQPLVRLLYAGAIAQIIHELPPAERREWELRLLTGLTPEIPGASMLIATVIGPHPEQRLAELVFHLPPGNWQPSESALTDPTQLAGFDAWMDWWKKQKEKERRKERQAEIERSRREAGFPEEWPETAKGVLEVIFRVDPDHPYYEKWYDQALERLPEAEKEKLGEFGKAVVGGEVDDQAENMGERFGGVTGPDQQLPALPGEEKEKLEDRLGVDSIEQDYMFAGENHKSSIVDEETPVALELAEPDDVISDGSSLTLVETGDDTNNWSNFSVAEIPKGDIYRKQSVTVAENETTDVHFSIEDMFDQLPQLRIDPPSSSGSPADKPKDAHTGAKNETTEVHFTVEDILDQLPEFRIDQPRTPIIARFQVPFRKLHDTADDTHNSHPPGGEHVTKTVRQLLNLGPEEVKKFNPKDFWNTPDGQIYVRFAPPRGQVDRVVELLREREEVTWVERDAPYKVQNASGDP